MTFNKNSIKSLLVGFLALLLSCLLCACGGEEKDAPLTQDGFTFVWVGDGYEVESYVGKETVVTVPAEINGLPVISVGKRAFYKHETVRTVILSDGITSVKEEAFASCPSLVGVNMPDTLLSLDTGVFKSCTALSKIRFSAALSKISKDLFHECSALTELSLPDQIAYIDDGAFQNCTSLSSVKLPKDTTYLGACFIGCISLKTVTIPKNVRAIEPNTFWQCRALADITFSDNVTVIGDGAFHACVSLQSVRFPRHLTKIGIGAFEDCTALSSVTLFAITDSKGNPAPFYIEKNAFLGCSLLTTVHYNGTEAQFAALTVTEEGNGAFFATEISYSNTQN